MSDLCCEIDLVFVVDISGSVRNQWDMVNIYYLNKEKIIITVVINNNNKILYKILVTCGDCGFNGKNKWETFVMYDVN